MNRKILFIALITCIICIGIGIIDLIYSYNETQQFKFRDLIKFIPFFSSGGIFYYILFIQKEQIKS